MEAEAYLAWVCTSWNYKVSSESFMVFPVNLEEEWQVPHNTNPGE